MDMQNSDDGAEAGASPGKRCRSESMDAMQDREESPETHCRLDTVGVRCGSLGCRFTPGLAGASMDGHQVASHVKVGPSPRQLLWTPRSSPRCWLLRGLV